MTFAEPYTLVEKDEVGSTNDEAKVLAVHGAKEWTVVTAQQQTKGRGRYGRSWISPKGNLYLSVVLRPTVSLATASQFSLVAAVSAGEVVEDITGEGTVTFKWPNDILLEGKKVGGILVESGSKEGNKAADWLVLGIGVNLASFPSGSDVSYPATSLLQETGKLITPSEILEPLIAEFRDNYYLWLSNGLSSFRKRWLKKAARLGQRIEIQLENQRISGVFRDIDAEGALLLEQQHGITRRITSGEVFFNQSKSI